MFNSISGTLSAKFPNTLMVENSGIEWEFSVSDVSLDAFGTVGSKVRVFTHLVHREDQMRLYGFVSELERDMFLDLIKVNGVGPRQAIKILSSITVTELETALETEDLARLEMAPGIGKKTAQKMILALKGKLTHISSDRTNTKKQEKSEYEDIIVSLVDMGFDRKAVSEKITDLAQELKKEERDLPESAVNFEQELFRRAIISLSSR